MTSAAWEPPPDRYGKPRTPPTPAQQQEAKPMTEDQLVALARELATIQDNAAQLADQEADVKARIRALVPGPDKYAAGDITVLVQTNIRFDQKKAEEAIPAEILPLVTVEKTVRTIDRKKVEVLAPAYLDACIAHFEDKVSLR